MPIGSAAIRSSEKSVLFKVGPQKTLKAGMSRSSNNSI